MQNKKCRFVLIGGVLIATVVAVLVWMNMSEKEVLESQGEASTTTTKQVEMSTKPESEMTDKEKAQQRIREMKARFKSQQ